MAEGGAPGQVALAVDCSSRAVVSGALCMARPRDPLKPETRYAWRSTVPDAYLTPELDVWREFTTGIALDDQPLAANAADFVVTTTPRVIARCCPSGVRARARRRPPARKRTPPKTTRPRVAHPTEHHRPQREPRHPSQRGPSAPSRDRRSRPTTDCRLSSGSAPCSCRCRRGVVARPEHRGRGQPTLRAGAAQTTAKGSRKREAPCPHPIDVPDLLRLGSDTPTCSRRSRSTPTDTTWRPSWAAWVSAAHRQGIPRQRAERHQDRPCRHCSWSVRGTSYVVHGQGVISMESVSATTRW